MRILESCSILLLVVTFHLFKWCSCEWSFLIPKTISESEESFTFNEIEYIFTSERRTWEEANVSCAAVANSSLAIIDSIEKAYFLSLALAETDVVLEDLWIGADRLSCPIQCENVDDDVRLNCFKWLNGNLVNASLMIPRKFEMCVTARNCLSFARNDHQKPSFVDLNCNLKRPYICEQPSNEQYGKMTHPEWITIGNYQYAIFYDKKTWKESVKECLGKHKAQLANFRTMKEVTGIGKYLLLGRPTLENAWIGGYYNRENWRFISIDTIIANTTNANARYPPWPDSKYMEDLTHEACLLLDKEMTEDTELVFLPVECHQQKSYICSKKKPEENPFETMVIDDVCYTVFYSVKTWEEAIDICITERNSWLVEVTEDKMDAILYIMGENRSEINHIWIGGKLKADNQWYWMHSNRTLTKHSENGYPPWLDSMFEANYSCLNMDRENHNKPMFYGVNCRANQNFICETYDIDRCKPLWTEPATTTEAVTKKVDKWKWKWPSEDTIYVQIKPFFNWTLPPNKDKNF